MTPAEILLKIVEADKNARDVYDSTMELRDGFDGYVAGRVEEIRKEYFEKADERIAEAEKKIVAEADEAMAASDARLEKELSEAKTHFCNEKTAVINRIFQMAVNVNA